MKSSAAWLTSDENVSKGFNSFCAAIYQKVKQQWSFCVLVDVPIITSNASFIWFERGWRLKSTETPIFWCPFDFLTAPTTRSECLWIQELSFILSRNKYFCIHFDMMIVWWDKGFLPIKNHHLRLTEPSYFHFFPDKTYPLKMDLNLSKEK